jgi:MoxR-like ATPase
MPSGENQFEWREGPAIRAWRGPHGHGSRLVLDEVDRASGDALATLLAVTDSPESARWRNPDTLEWVRPGDQFSVVMTSNVEDVSEIPPSLRDRFPISIRVDRPHAEAVERLSRDLRAAAMAGSLGPEGRRLSLRSFYAFDELRRHHGPERAAELVFGSSSAQSILDALAIGTVA